MPFVANGIAPPLPRIDCFPHFRCFGRCGYYAYTVGADSISARRRLSDRLPPGWEQGAVASPRRPAPQGCLKEKAQSKEDTSASTKENRGKHLIQGKSLLSYPPAPSTASRSPSLPEGGIGFNRSGRLHSDVRLRRVKFAAVGKRNTCGVKFRLTAK